MSGAVARNRTPDIPLTRRALFHLSYYGNAHRGCNAPPKPTGACGELTLPNSDVSVYTCVKVFMETDMRVKITAPFDYVTTRAKNGLALGSVAYSPTKTPVTVPQVHGEAGVAAGKMVEVKDPAKRPEPDAK